MSVSFPSQPALWMEPSVGSYHIGGGTPNLGYIGGMFLTQNYTEYNPNLNGGVYHINNPDPWTQYPYANQSEYPQGIYFEDWNNLTHGNVDYTICIGFCIDYYLFHPYNVGQCTIFSAHNSQIELVYNYVGLSNTRNFTTKNNNSIYAQHTALNIPLDDPSAPEIGKFYVYVYTISYENLERRIKIYRASDQAVIYDYSLSRAMTGIGFQPANSAYPNFQIGYNTANWNRASLYVGNFNYWELGFNESQMDNLAAHYLNKYSVTPDLNAPNKQIGTNLTNCTIIRYEGGFDNRNFHNVIWEIVIFVDGHVELRFSTLTAATGGFSGVWNGNGSDGVTTTSWPNSGYSYVWDMSKSVLSNINLTNNGLYRNGSIVSQTNYPTLSGQNSATALGSTPTGSGWVTLTQSYADNAFEAVPLLEGTIIHGRKQDYAYVSSNSYITFEAGDTLHYPGTSTPSLTKISINGGDRSYRRVFYKYDSM